jgi:hypothetical protein|uniref:Choline binding protein n=1 Tax=Siphoviridae sp. ctvxh7 TaxID=2827283 RepID=A0A8S5RAG4_9CAUD|nr:MAG TPA: choline binding protein [Siphoviridae sp. ctvxh7]
MAEYLAKSEDLTAVADAIRAKGGTDAQLTFPGGFVGAVQAISAGTTITDGIVVTARDADGYATVVDFYGRQICIEQFGCQYEEADNPFLRLAKVNVKQAVTVIGPRAFNNNVSLQELTGVDFGAITSIGNKAFFNAQRVALGDVDLVSLAKYPEDGIFQNCGGITKLTVHADGNIHYNLCNKCSGLTDIVIDCSVAFTDGGTDSGYSALGRNTALVNCKIGNVGKPCKQTSLAMLSGCTNKNLVVEIYVAGENVDTAVSNIRNGATNATIIIKAAADTTYNGVAYAAGDTILTSTPEAST